MMQNFCILILILFIGIQLKSTRSTFTGDHQSESDYRWRPLNSDVTNTQKLLNNNEDESWNLDETNSITEDKSRYRYPYVESFNYDNIVRLPADLLRLYSGLKKDDLFNVYMPGKGLPTRYTKRALTMLSRWKPFRIPNAIGGNGRHVIRSPFISRSDPSSAYSKMQIMGRPFRWG